MEKSSFPQNLRFYLDYCSISQAQMAKMLNITPAAFNYYVNGTREPKLTTLKKIAEIFNISIDNLLADSFTPPQTDYAKELNQYFSDSVFHAKNVDDNNIVIEYTVMSEDEFLDFQQLNDEQKHNFNPSRKVEKAIIKKLLDDVRKTTFSIAKNNIETELYKLFISSERRQYKPK